MSTKAFQVIIPGYPAKVVIAPTKFRAIMEAKRNLGIPSNVDVTAAQATLVEANI